MLLSCLSVVAYSEQHKRIIHCVQDHVNAHMNSSSPITYILELSTSMRGCAEDGIDAHVRLCDYTITLMASGIQVNGEKNSCTFDVVDRELNIWSSRTELTSGVITIMLKRAIEEASRNCQSICNCLDVNDCQVMFTLLPDSAIAEFMALNPDSPVIEPTIEEEIVTPTTDSPVTVTVEEVLP